MHCIEKDFYPGSVDPGLSGEECSGKAGAVVLMGFGGGEISPLREFIVDEFAPVEMTVFFG